MPAATIAEPGPAPAVEPASSAAGFAAEFVLPVRSPAFVFAGFVPAAEGTYLPAAPLQTESRQTSLSCRRR